MVIREDQERVRALLKDTITLLCKNGLNFDTEFSVDALIGITLDKRDVFLVSINEIVQSEFALQKAAAQQSGLAGDESVESGDSEEESEHRRRRRRRKRRRSSIEHKQPKQPIVDNSEDGMEDSYSELDDSQHAAPAVKKSDFGSGRALVKKEENAGDSDDLVFVKQEVDKDHWSACQQGDGEGMPSTSQDLDFLQGASLVPVGHSTADNFNSGAGSMARTSTVTSNYKGAQSQFALTKPRPSMNKQLTEGRPPVGDNTPVNSPQESCSAPQKNKQWGCTVCHKSFVSIQTLKIHVDSIHKKRFHFECEICGKGYNDRDNLKGHMSSKHSKVKEFLCTCCQRTFAYKQNMFAHMKRCFQKSCSFTYD